MIALFTDYGLGGPYLGQVQAVLHRDAPGVQIVNLFADVPRQNVKAGAYLLRACSEGFTPGTVFLCVVDPGVGTFADPPIALQVGECWFVGPDNGLFDQLAWTAGDIECLEITWRPQHLSSSFHGRDLYAPVAARLANGRRPKSERRTWKPRHDWPRDLSEVIYVDHFGNLVTGLRADVLDPDAVVKAGGSTIRHARTFGEVERGQVFWYANSSGLMEIAVNHGRADQLLQLGVGDVLEAGGNPAAA